MNQGQVYKIITFFHWILVKWKCPNSYSVCLVWYGLPKVVFYLKIKIDEKNSFHENNPFWSYWSQPNLRAFHQTWSFQMHNMREAEGIGNNFIVLWPLRGHYTAGIRPARHKDRSHRGKNNYDIEFCCPDPINNYHTTWI